MVKVVNLIVTPKECRAVQYNGYNIEEIAEYFNFDYKVLNSSTDYEGKSYKDIHIIQEDEFKEELLVGDYVYKNEDGRIVVIPIYDIGKYWEVV